MSIVGCYEYDQKARVINRVVPFFRDRLGYNRVARASLIPISY
jgi:hypothetical protein